MKVVRWMLWVGVAVFLSVGRPLFGLTITSLTPAGCQVAPLTTGTPCYTDRPDTITGIPLALNGGTLIRTRAADASDPNLSVTFTVDVRSEVYVCYDARSPVPPWLGPWVQTEMAVDVSGSAAGRYRVCAKRFQAGQVTLSANQADAMYFVVVKESLPVLPRNGWVLLSYDMPYLREIITKAPEYNVNHIQISHDLIMFTQEVLLDRERRDDINELINLAHAYGITDVTLWTHEMETIDIPPQYLASDGRGDGDDPGIWQWMKQRYIDLFTPGIGCPEVDGIVLTFSELSMFLKGDEVFDRAYFKHDSCTPTQSIAKVLQELQEVCTAYDKTFYARCWAGIEQYWIRDAIALTGDNRIWMMNKNVGDVNGHNQDWQFMDSHCPTIGTLPAEYSEMIEFDLCGEYLGRSQYTYCMGAYLKDHWNYALARGADGMVVRIDREGSPNYYTSNRINLFLQRELIANPNADPLALNLSWCQQSFPPEAAQDVADSYDAPDSPWEGDTRYMTWEVHHPSLAPVTNAQALSIAYAAIERIDRHRAQLETQRSLDTRDGQNDYQTLRYGIALALLDLGGTLPETSGFFGFQPVQTASLAPDCSISIRLPAPGLDESSVGAEYSVDGGTTWNPWLVSVTGSAGSTGTEQITAAAVPFNQLSESDNLIRFHAADTAGTPFQSGPLRVVVVVGPVWSGFQPVYSSSQTPDCSVAVAANGQPLDPESARYSYSVDGGATWRTPEGEDWPNRYECDIHPIEAGWTKIEGRSGYESIEEGILRINDTGTSWGDKVKYAVPWSVDTSRGATVLARMRCLSGGHFYAGNINLADSLHSDALYLKGSGIMGLANYGALVPAGAQEWHTYRVTIKEDDIMVYLDEDPEPILRGNGAFIHGTGSQQLVIGSGASQYTQDVYYDYVYWTTEGAFAPGAWWNAQFDGSGQGGTLLAPAVAFNQESETLNRIRFAIDDIEGNTYEGPVYTVATDSLWADFDSDLDVDLADFGVFQVCLSGSAFLHGPGCERADHDGDGDVDAIDLTEFQSCLEGPGRTPGCF